MSWKSLLWGSAMLALMLEAAACGLYASGIGPEGAGGSGGAASSSAQSGSSASSGSGTSSSSGSGTEDCFDNKDNDGNTQTDCADPSCTGVAQCDTIPAGWTLVSATLVMSDPLPAADICADGKTMQLVYFTLPGPPATCSQCLCSLDAGTCSTPKIECYYTDNNCGGPVGTTQQPSMSGCVLDLPGVTPMGNSNGSCKISTPSTIQGDKCTPTGGAPTTGPMWGGAVYVCPGPSSPGGCGNGQSCIPAGPTSDGKVCIRRDGTDLCPAGWTNAISAFKGGTDNRSCSKCTCTVGCAGDHYKVFDNDSCNGGPDPAVDINPVGCTTTPNIFDLSTASLQVTLATPGVSSCPQSQPQGQVDTSGPVQICCK